MSPPKRSVPARVSLEEEVPTRRPGRIVVSDVQPSVESGRYPAKAIAGDVVGVEADLVCDGRDVVFAELRWQREGDDGPAGNLPMYPLGNDRYRADFVVATPGTYRFSVQGSVDRYRSWAAVARAKLAAGQVERAEVDTGMALVHEAIRRARGDERAALRSLLDTLSPDDVTALSSLTEAVAESATSRHVLGTPASASGWYVVAVERERARFSSWYELFPRSASPVPGRPGTLRDVIDRLDYVASMHFDVLYLPPVHPIGTTDRKGANGATEAGAGDPGSPWAIGAVEGGHCAIHPDLGTIEDFDALAAAANALGLEVALDLAFQCSPDHPWVREHPEWFHHRPDGTIAYAENPPKRYQDVYPIEFATPAWRELWAALREVVEYWIGHGVSIFRVDNPHTKPFAFWQWLIETVRREHPEVFFLAEAFTRPKVMYQLAKVGFSQSYTYFTWRNGRGELEEYLRELSTMPVGAFFRPNFWPNTPDILSETLQRGGAAVFRLRALLAATLSASWGVYGPVFELMAHRSREEGSEEYAASEKYEVRHWDLDNPRSLAPFLATLNAVRLSHRAFRRNDTIAFHGADNPQLLVYSKAAPPAPPGGDVAGEGSDAPILVVANLDTEHRQSGWVDLDTGAGGLPAGPLELHDLLSGARYRWEAGNEFVILDPSLQPAHVFEVRAARETVTTR